MSATLTTDRLVLRPYQRSDAWALAHHLSDVRVSWTLGRVPHPYALEDAHAFLETRPDGFVVTLKDSGDLIGACGVHETAEKRAMPGFEIGYWIGLPFWGCGYATETARAVTGDWFARSGGAELYSGHFIDNPASGRVLEKAGFETLDWGEVWCEARQHHVAHRWLRLTRARWDDLAHKGA